MINLLDQAKSLYSNGQHKAAVDVLQRLLKECPHNWEARVLFGIICLKSERLEGAEEHFREVLRQSPANREALIWLAMTKKSQQYFEEAIQLANRAIELQPDALSYNTLGVCLLSKREPKRAISAFENALKFDSTSGAIFQNLGLALRLDEKRFEALEAFKRAVELAPENPDNWLEVCEQLQRLSRWTDAIAFAQSGLERFPDSTAFMIVLANAYSVIREPQQAEQMFKKAMELRPATTQSYAQWLVEEGRFEDSLSCLVQSVRLKPVQGYAYYCLAESKRFEIDGESWIEKAEEIYKHPVLRLKDRMFLDYALGMAYEVNHDYERSMLSFDKACDAAFRIYNAGRPFVAEAGRYNLERRISLYSAENIAELRRGGSADETPILIVGMIRSGTTLLEQIVSSHRDVRAAGELSFWILEGDRLGKKWSANGIDAGDLAKVARDYRYVLETVAGKAARITDKMPLNFEHVGLIHSAFPKAKILHMRRNPVDTCLSVYTTHYGSGPNFGYSQANILAYYRGYLELMDHWRQVIPVEQLYEVDYEDLIYSREESTRNIVDFLGLKWDDACLHHEQNRSAINTPSRWQARQPIYKSSVERWRFFEPYLGALLELEKVSHPLPMRPSFSR